ncbi:hypothetical protein Trydic_g3244 [Trypoxylus dichotomus]
MAFLTTERRRRTSAYYNSYKQPPPSSPRTVRKGSRGDNFRSGSSDTAVGRGRSTEVRKYMVTPRHKIHYANAISINFQRFQQIKKVERYGVCIKIRGELAACRCTKFDANA